MHYVHEGVDIFDDVREMRSYAKSHGKSTQDLKLRKESEGYGKNQDEAASMAKGFLSLHAQETGANCVLLRGGPEIIVEDHPRTGTGFCSLKLIGDLYRIE